MNETEKLYLQSFLNRKIASWRDLSLTEWLSVLLERPRYAKFCPAWNSFTINQIKKLCAAQPLLCFYLYLRKNLDFFGAIYSLNPENPVFLEYLEEFKKRAGKYRVCKSLLKDAHVAFKYSVEGADEENWAVFFKPGSELLALSCRCAGETYYKTEVENADINCGLKCPISVNAIKSGRFALHADIAAKPIREIPAFLAED
ncbi:MAG: hypothetical protein IKO42_06415 [Opitutales bacterium]|nr:hypothetical protein [Opitutales bacterium]